MIHTHTHTHTHTHILVSSVAQSCLTLCDTMDCSMPGFFTHHQLQHIVVYIYTEREREGAHPII